MQSLYSRAEELRRAEVARATRGLDPEQRAALDNFSRSLVTKLLHEPTRRLREAGSLRQAETLRDLFALDERPDAEVVELRAVG